MDVIFYEDLILRISIFANFQKITKNSHCVTILLFIPYDSGPKGPFPLHMTSTPEKNLHVTPYPTNRNPKRDNGTLEVNF